MIGKKTEAPNQIKVEAVPTKQLLARYPIVRDAVIMEIRRTGSLAIAAHKVLLRPHVITAHMEINPEFKEAVDHAFELHNASIEAEIRRRGMHGWLEPRFSSKGKIGSVRKYSDQMLALYAKKHIPAYRAADTSRVEVDGKVEHDHRVGLDPSLLRPEQRSAMRVLLGGEDVLGDEEIPKVDLSIRTAPVNGRNGNGVSHEGAAGLGDGAS